MSQEGDNASIKSGDSIGSAGSKPESEEAVPVRELDDGDDVPSILITESPTIPAVEVTAEPRDQKHVRLEMETFPGHDKHSEDGQSIMSKTTLGSQGGRRKKLRHFNLNNINRYGTIESTYLCELERSDRIIATEKFIQQREIHFITPSEVNSMKKALRIEITEDYEGVPEAVSKIKMKVCFNYIPDTENAKEGSEPLCCCGRQRSDPDHKVYSDSRKRHWKSDKHTNEIPTDTWGKVSLSGCQANFLRLTETTPMKKVEDLLTVVYKMKKPGVILSVLGSVQQIDLPDKLEDIIERDLPKSAAACDAWVTTPGVNSGCAKPIGNGIRTYGLSLVAIGILDWGSIHPKAQKKLTGQTNEMGNAVSYPTGIHENDDTHLEQNHSTFLMVDNGQIGSRYSDHPESIAAAIDFRYRFEDHMRAATGVPVVSVVIKGGFRTSMVINKRLNNNHTVIVLAKSGGAASLIFRVMEHIKVVEKLGSKEQKLASKYFLNRSKSSFDVGDDKSDKGNCSCFKSKGIIMASACSYINRKINKHLKANMIDASQEKWETIYKFLDTCVQKRNLIFVYNARENVPFDKMLLDAMVEYGSGKANIGRELGYAFELGTVDVVESMLNDAADRVRSQTLTVLITKAIIMNRPTMVKLFLNTCHKSQLQQLKFNMPILYDSALYTYGGSHLVRLISYWVSKSIIPGATTLGIFPPDKNGQTKDYATSGSDNSDPEDEYKPAFSERWNPDAIKLINNLINTLAGQSFDSAVGCEEDSYMELTMWSVMMLRKEMALLFCKRSEDPIRCSLLCLKLMTQMESRKNVLVNSEEDEKLVEMKEAFESLAICTLEACYQENPEMTFAAARARWKRVKDYDYLQLAYEADCKRFLAHPACQDISEKRWRVGFVKDEGFWKVFLICIFPPFILIPGLIEFDVFAYRHQDGVERPWWDKCFVKCKILGKSPMIKFWMNAFFSAAFIVLHLRVLYMDTKPILNPDTDEHSWPLLILMVVWLSLLVIDEILQIYTEKLFYWWKNVWNRLDLFMYVMLFTGLILCMVNICTDSSGQCLLSKTMDGSVECDAHYTGTCDPADAAKVHAGRMILSMVTILLFLRWGMFMTSDLTLGPIVLMLIEMLSTFINFFMIFCVLLLGFGAAYIGLLVEVGTFNIRNVVGMIYYTYFQSLGELFIDVLEAPESYYLNNRSPNFTDSALASDTPWYQLSNVNWGYYGVALGLLTLFMIFSNLMLLNILIAMFTESYERISADQKTIWKFQRYSLLKDYESKFLPTPLNLIHYPLFMLRSAWKLKIPKREYVNPLKKSIDKHLRAFVKEGLQTYIKAVGVQEEAMGNRYLKYSVGL